MAHEMYSEIRSLIRHVRSIAFALALAGQDPRVPHYDWTKNGVRSAHAAMTYTCALCGTFEFNSPGYRRRQSRIVPIL